MYYLTDWIVLRLSGNVKKLLQGLVSNDISAPQNAFLDRFGKIVVVFDLKWDGDDALIVFNGQFSQRLYEHLSKYLRLMGTTAKKEQMFVYHDLEGNSEGIPTKAGTLVLSHKKIESTVSDEEYITFRVEHSMPLQGVDFDTEMLLNVFNDGTYVSYEKGCYLGQEIIARVHNLAKPPKKLIIQEGTFVFVKND